MIDCDTGVDDAFAIQFLLNHDDVEILAITTWGKSILWIKWLIFNSLTQQLPELGIVSIFNFKNWYCQTDFSISQGLKHFKANIDNKFSDAGLDFSERKHKNAKMSIFLHFEKFSDVKIYGQK